MNINSRIIIKNLYKESLKTVRGLGYRYGSLERLNNKNWICEEKILTKRRFRKLYRNNDLGPFLAVNIRFQYEMGKRIHDENDVEMLIDEGFSALRTLNYLMWYIEKLKQEDATEKNQK
tara:strand:- start:1954 stop:2310 length:357 start_codon:yes stop_codon:yes gene_type:complete